MVVTENISYIELDHHAKVRDVFLKSTTCTGQIVEAIAVHYITYSTREHTHMAIMTSSLCLRHKCYV